MKESFVSTIDIRGHFEARAGTIGAPPEAYLEWADTSPVPLSTVAEELGVIPRNTDEEKRRPGI